MAIYTRKLDLKSLLKKNSFFLFGPRGTGKSFLIKQLFPKAQIYNLLDDEVFEQLLRRPKIIEERLGKHKLVIIDEIQKLPKLLDEVHRLIELKNIRFLLTGSSARKLKKGGANLLAGRAWEANLFSLSYSELPDFDLNKYLNYGGLPRVWISQAPEEELHSYVKNYLKEEIKAEALVRSYERFVYFLDAMSLNNAKELHYQNISSECGIPVRTLEGYLEILKDTLVGHEVLPFRKTKKRIAYAKSKFYFFDIGVANSISQKLPLNENHTDYGDAFETFIVNEVRAYLSYKRKNIDLYYWRTKICEVDLLIGSKIAIEIKSTRKIKDEYFTGLQYLQEEQIFKKYYLVTRADNEGVCDEISYINYKNFLNLLWKGKII